MSTQPNLGNINTDYPGQPGLQRNTGRLLATQGYVLGIEISSSGARQSVALADLNGQVLYQLRRPLEYVPDTETVLSLLNEMIAEATQPERLPKGRLLRIGIAVGGLVEATQGIVRTLYHAQQWNNFPLQDYFAEKLDVPCIIDNNANAAGLGEVLHGAGQGERVVLYIGLGRGIGGGLIVNGRIFHGASGTAGEIGHTLVKENGPECSCGGAGHLEAIASARSIIHSMRNLAQEYPESLAAIERITRGQPENLTAEQVFQLGAEGDKIAQQVVQQVHTYLGGALANIVQLINPSMIILGGPVAQAGDLLIEPLRQRIQELCLPAASQSLRIVQGHLGNEANLVGAITLALQDI
ncbi:ROK family protein [Tengunoibacter tsumagoiensis]|uniref:Transcriptional regulator n=1 Tax=Tengunoibacter tsumagoiensis TaxID=2014871 RepID=A0A401ZV93_9CHLR|nr:ROK family protein [Tengunoibacter tsumagoiensis]GCE10722.1 transcriptional regulator [Tengunoibacter tsumagoiensis]